MEKKQLLLGVLFVVAIIVSMFFSGLIAFATDWWWFSEVRFTEIFFTSLFVKAGTGVIVGLFAAIFLYVNFFIAVRSRVPWNVRISEQVVGRPMMLVASAVKIVALAVSVSLGFFVGVAASASWQDVLRYIYATPFGTLDPLFAKDLSFYIFSLPVYSLGVGIFQFLVVVSLIVCAAIYFFQGILNPGEFFSRLFRRFGHASAQAYPANHKPRTHLGILLAFFFAASAVGSILSMYGLVLSSSGVVFGATAAHVAILRPLFIASSAIFALSSFFSFLFAFSGKAAPVLGCIALSIVVSVGGGIAVPLYQKVIISPNELVQETPYIKSNIASTRAAYGLKNIEEREIAAGKPLNAQAIAANDATLKNVRLWDRDPLLSTFSQIQEIRTYYEFRSVDNDRYSIGGDLRQIMLSPRELAADSLPNKNWINERLTFTHGYGITAGPVNQVTPEGLPVLFVKDLPPKSDIPELAITRPEIYYGELANDYVIVKTKSREFDYPKGDENVSAVYDGNGGVRLSSLFQRLVYAIKFGEPKILLSGDITNESRILVHRVITDRVSKIAPFLLYDKDPYMVINNGKIVWILDAYTATDRYPYSQPIVMENQKVNYVRNSVKAIVDAYDGTVDFYIAEPNDPLIKTYARAFPHSFHPLSDLSENLRAHLRYPEDIFAAQTAVYATYHMEDPQIFYNKEDLWEIPAYAERSAEEEHSSSMEPRHMIMKLPGEKKEEFILMIPFTPRSKDNLSAWMVARNDGANYGSLTSYRFPKDTLIFGPKQVIGRINQDPEISGQISLWDQRGSQVIQGPLLVIPVEESLLYVRPLYLKAETGKIPELKRVIVAYDNKVAMEETLEQALAKIFGKSGAKKEEATQKPARDDQGTQNSSPAKENTFQKARELYDAALRAQKEGDWANYGEYIKKLGESLQGVTK